MHEHADRPLLVLVASGRQEYREDALASIARRFRVHLIEGAEPTWQRPYLDSYDVVPGFEETTLIPLGQRLAGQRTVAGVVCWDEARILPATVLADTLGLPSAGTEAVRCCRDKYATRKRLAEHGAPQPRFALVSDVDGAREAARRIGYPLVLKPRSAAASLGVVRVEGEQELNEQFTFASGASISGAPQHQDPVLLEEFVGGAEVSVDSLVEDGAATPLFVARKSVGFAPFFEETGHEVSSHDPLLDDPEFTQVIKKIHHALDFGWGWTHVEMKLTERGPVLVEVNARIGGDLIPRLAYLAHGIDAADLVADAVRGIRQPLPQPTPTARRPVVAASRFLYPDQDDVVVESVAFDETALPAGIDRAVVLTEPGAHLRLPPEGLFSGRAALISVTAEDSRSAHEVLDIASDALRLHVSDRKGRSAESPLPNTSSKECAH
ncbi:ATP-grasp domain-containing protein [Streptomyces sp. NRRL F-5755]|uniref:ATP-grasp domain-containing protein n=1 Tax=Streptomyces sp. NRRL F-5755 TaxID=1519475 RepID=UPI000B2490E2|nr:ATP-grasp domain-containing protein [Streptomyces sp. NRRL F-5755]